MSSCNKKNYLETGGLIQKAADNFIMHFMLGRSRNFAKTSMTLTEYLSYSQWTLFLRLRFHVLKSEFVHTLHFIPTNFRETCKSRLNQFSFASTQAPMHHFLLIISSYWPFMQTWICNNDQHFQFSFETPQASTNNCYIITNRFATRKVCYMYAFFATFKALRGESVRSIEHRLPLLTFELDYELRR